MAVAMLTGIDTCTSSLLRIAHGRDGQRLNVRRLYPPAGGAGYLGEIMWAGVDGIEVAEAVPQSALS